MVNAVNPAIISNITKVKMRQRIFPTLTVKQQYNFIFNNALDFYNSTDYYGKSVRSTEFMYNGLVCFLAEKSFASTTLCVFAKTATGLVEQTEIGTVDYTQGIIFVNSFVPDSWIGQLNYIDLSVQPKIPNIIPARNQILVIEQQDIIARVEQIR